MRDVAGKTFQRLARRRGSRQRGNAIVVAMIALTGLAMLGAVTAANVQSGLSAANAERSATIARYAAESGLAATMYFMRARSFASGQWFSNSIRINGDWEESDTVIGHDDQPGQAGNQFSAQMRAWYSARFRNNVDDPNFASAAAAAANEEDSDGRFVVRVDGYGPDGARIAIEAEIEGELAGADLDKLTITSWRELSEVDF